jgi:hypothetical protein
LFCRTIQMKKKNEAVQVKVFHHVSPFSLTLMVLYILEFVQASFILTIYFDVFH